MTAWVHSVAELGCVGGHAQALCAAQFLCATPSNGSKVTARMASASDFLAIFNWHDACNVDLHNASRVPERVMGARSTGPREALPHHSHGAEPRRDKSPGELYRRSLGSRTDGLSHA